MSDLGGGGLPPVGDVSRTCKATMQLLGSNLEVSSSGGGGEGSQGSFAGWRRRRRELSEEVGWEEKKEHPTLPLSRCARKTRGGGRRKVSPCDECVVRNCGSVTSPVRSRRTALLVVLGNRGGCEGWAGAKEGGAGGWQGWGGVVCV